MATIYHISDLHTEGGPIGSTGNKKIKKLMTLIANEIASTEGKTMLIITGDVVDSGDGNEYSQLYKLLKVIPETTKIRFVPGNHDVGGMFGTSFKNSAVRHFDDLVDTFGQASEFSKKYANEYPGYSPSVEIFHNSDNEAVFRIIYLNTVCEDKSGDFATGTVGYYQTTKLKEALEQKFGGKTVVCMHHKPVTPGIPLFIMDLNIEDRKTMRQFAEEYKIDAILYGHQNPSNTIPGDFIRRKDGEKCVLLNANSSVKDKFFHRIRTSAAGEISIEKVHPTAELGQPE